MKLKRPRKRLRPAGSRRLVPMMPCSMYSRCDRGHTRIEMRLYHLTLGAVLRRYMRCMTAARCLSSLHRRPELYPAVSYLHREPYSLHTKIGNRPASCQVWHVEQTCRCSKHASLCTAIEHSSQRANKIPCSPATSIGAPSGDSSDLTPACRRRRAIEWRRVRTGSSVCIQTQPRCRWPWARRCHLSPPTQSTTTTICAENRPQNCNMLRSVTAMRYHSLPIMCLKYSSPAITKKNPRRLRA